MFLETTLLSFSLLSVTYAQQVAFVTTEAHPSLVWSKCTASGCTSQAGKITLDANWRWLHNTTGFTNCYTGNTWDASLCPDGKTCASNCALDGADYQGTAGITTSGNAVTLKFKPASGSASKLGSRIYLMNTDTQYEIFKPLGQEIAFDVDASRIPCGVSGALYFAEMDADGGMAKYPTNKAGAKYGTGYCDSRCPRDLRFINGEANVQGWVPSSTDTTAGRGNWGACCAEMDIWEANSISAAYTPHPCSASGLTRCEGTSCGTSDRYATVCDPDGCDFNSYRMGDKTFYGPGMVVNTKQKYTVITQFLTDDGSSSGVLKEIRRLYVQNGKVIQNSKVNISGMDPSMDSITGPYCDAQKSVFHDKPQFQNKGGLSQMTKAFSNGMVLVLAIRSEPESNMRWLDAAYPIDADPTLPGVVRGGCSANAYPRPEDIETYVDTQVIFSNIRFGSIGSTYGSGSTPTTTTTTTTTATTVAPSNPTQTKYGQCGGQGYSGPTVCASGSTCQALNPYFSQCL